MPPRQQPPPLASGPTTFETRKTPNNARPKLDVQNNWIDIVIYLYPRVAYEISCRSTLYNIPNIHAEIRAYTEAYAEQE